MNAFSSLSRSLSARLCAAFLGLAAVGMPHGAVQAQTAYPAKPIRLIVPFPPGGGTDMIARAVAQKVADQNKWSVIVDNRPVPAAIWGWTPWPSPTPTATPW